jgi:ABC-type nitrate/sulfonate/bicarbonate transport system substrate-binding protein
MMGEKRCKRMNKTFLIILLLGIFLVIGCVKEEKKYDKEISKITLAAYEGDTGLLPYIAEKKGYFASNGLDVAINNYDSGKAAADALIAGEADISTSAGAVLVSGSFDYPDLRLLVLGTIAIAEKQGLVARKDRGITQPSDLAGKRIGLSKKTSAEFNLGVFLVYNGLSINDLEIVDLNPREIADKVVSGEIDAGFTWEPNIHNAKAQLGDNALVIKENVPEFNFLLLSKKEWLENNPDTAKRFVKAIVQAEEYVKENEEGTKQFMADTFDYEKEYVDAAWEDHDFAVTLPQSLLLQFEDIARWRIKNELTAANKIPNYLDHIYFDALEEVKPESVTIIK